MATFSSLAEYRRAVADMRIVNRETFLKTVVHSRIMEPESPYIDEPTSRAICFCQHYGLVKTSYRCGDCAEEWGLYVSRAKGRPAKWYWRGPRHDAGCASCNSQKVSMTMGTVFHGVPSTLWLKLLDAMVMWCFEYPQDIIMKELNLGSHHTATKRLRRFQKVAVAYMQDKIVFSDIHKELYKKPAGCNANLQKKPAGALSPDSKIRPKSKKPTSNSPVLRRPAAVKKFALKKKPAASTLPAARTNKIVVQMDESFLNKSKPGALSKAARPKKDQVRVQGFVVSGHPEYFFYTVLQHPEDCIDGKPRGKGEVLKNLNRVGLQKNTILVSDGWKGTVAAVKQYRRDHGLTAAQFPHEIVVHSKGEIKNAKGFTTNAIESRWSVLKRWLRRKCSGRLPIHSDRGAWDMLLGEFTYRKFAQSTQRTRSRVRPGMVELRVQVEHFLTAMREYTWGA